jgi:MFS family permease
VVSAIGLAFTFIPLTIAALMGVQESDAGIASGLLNTTQQIGGAVGLAAASTIATTFTAHYVTSHPGASPLSGPALTYGFQITFYVLAAIAAAGAVLAAALTESREVTVAAEPAEAELLLEAA